MGAILVAEKSDHKQALSWFEQAVPLLESPAPASASVHPGRHGETFVSMAVSYWELGQRSEALRLTEQGLKLMEQAAADGQLGARRWQCPMAIWRACTSCWATRGKPRNIPTWPRAASQGRSIAGFHCLLVTQRKIQRALLAS